MWKPGQSGNPAGPGKEKRFLAALERAVLQSDGEKLRAAAEKLLDCAAEGMPWAIQMLADRLDGRPTQQVDMIVTRAVQELPDDELQRIAAGSSDRASEAQGGEEKPSSVH